MKTCFKCGTVIEIEKVSRRDECPQCGSDLRVCLNCAFYAASRSNACEEPQAEIVKDKDKANYCDFFRFKDVSSGKDGTLQKSGKTQAQELWNELFKKKS